MSIVIALAALALVACGGGGGGDEESPTATVVATATEESSQDAARRVEADDDPSLPGEYVDLPAIYGGHYGGEPNTGPHVRATVDYSRQGLPPVGGPHWGSAACGTDPSEAPPFCGPAPWGIYREAWEPETLVHNMEHAGVVIWYNTSDQDVIDELEAFAQEKLSAGTLLVLAPYPDMGDETVAITVWSRRDVMAADELDLDRIQEFIDVLYCRFDPEGFC
ncbi:MAG: DUF3105 domain-containing protein [Chloroflexi bacterium]|nr:DUF3105 domain-containing protein [Chloroflexota bacterium]